MGRRILLLLAFGQAGCGSCITPVWTWEGVGQAALKAAISPRVLVPAAGAGLFQIGDWDDDFSHWAQKETPLFGSTNAADDSSDTFSIGAIAAAASLALVSTTGEGGEYCPGNKPWEFGFGTAALGMTWGATEGIKELAGRRRPHGSSNESFPSGHASAAASASETAIRHFQYLPIPDWSKGTAEGVFTLVPYATGWSRIEGGRHHPSDVLAGIALGAFVSGFANELLDQAMPEHLRLSVETFPDGAGIGFTIED